MKSLTEYLWFEVPGRRGFVNITDTIKALVRKSEVGEGICLVNAMHITAAVFINDAEDGLLHDFDVWLEKLAPHAPTSPTSTDWRRPCFPGTSPRSPGLPSSATGSSL